MSAATTAAHPTPNPSQQHIKPKGQSHVPEAVDIGLSPVPLVAADQPVSPSTPLSRVATATDESVIFTNPSSVDSTNTTTTHSQGEIHDDSEGRADNDLARQGSNANEKQRNEVIPHSNDRDNDEINNDFYDNNDTPLFLKPALCTIPTSPNLAEAPALPEVQKSLTGNSEHSVSTSQIKGSYIQDSNNDNVLLNNYTRKRKSTTRANSFATILDQPSLRSATGNTVYSVTNNANNNVNPRNSMMTLDSKGVDTATAEIERMRNSVLNQREKKKRQKSLYDDDRVLVGNKVSEGHVNYVIAYNMLTGIRVSVSQCSGIMKPLTEADFKLSRKLVFDVSGNELTPSSKYDFKFKDYCPTVFRELRIFFGLDPADYLVSLTAKYILSELSSPGKSGSFFYFSRDYRFIIKTIHPAEHRQLRRVLKDYYNHVKANPNTMISQFYGLHRVKMPIYYGKRRKIYFIIMNNLFPPHTDIAKTYDLKGSTLGRFTSPNLNSRKVLKDLNWLQDNEVIKFGPLKEQVFLEQLKRDVQLLIKLNIMDYSFLIGFHDLSKDPDGDALKRKKLSVFSPVSSNLHDLKNTNPKLLNHLNDLPTIEYPKGNIFYAEGGGIASSGEQDEPLQYVYYLGIIDCLTNYSIIKRLETFWRSLRHDRAIISAVPPKEYGERFFRFIQNSVNENTAGEAKNKVD